MTREEEIKQELKRRKQIGSDNPIRNNSFLLGALWADAHPVNPWHKVAGELPKVDKDRKCIKVFARKGDDVFVAFYSPVAGFSLTPSFYVEYALFDIEYWMEIPELPKED